MKTFDEISAYTSKNIFAWTNTLVRAAGFPIDKWSVFGSYDAAKQYVLENTAIPGMGDATALPYEGQLIAVANDDQQEVYVLDHTAPDGLRKLASGGDADDIARQLRELSSSLLSTDGIIDQLSTAIDENEAAAALSVENLSVDAYTNLSIALTSEEGTGSILKIYTLTQGGQEVGKIDIPKDLVIEAAGHVKYNGTDDTITLNGKTYTVKPNPKPAAGDYIVMITAVSEDQIWIDVKDLIADNVGDETTTIAVDVTYNTLSSKNIITAQIKAGSITRDLLSSDITTELDGLRTDVNTVSTDLIAEANRAYAAEQFLSNAIDTEVSERIANDDYLSGQIDAAVEATERAIESLQEDINNETSARIEADEALQAAITTEETRATQAESDLQSAIDDEATRAKASESALSDLVEAEETRATGAEADLQAAIEAEEARASGEEATLSGMISTEETERKAADTTLQTNINNLSTELTTAISNEASTRQAQDEALDAKIDANTAAIEAEKTRAEAKESTLSTKIDAEIARATAAEEANATAIETEKNRALTAEAGLDDKIDAEVERATQAESDLQANIDALSAYADETFETKIDATSKYNDLTGQIGAEATARTQADNALSDAIEDLSAEAYEKFVKFSDVNQEVTEDNKVATIKDVVGLSGVIHFRGLASALPEDPKTQKPDTSWYNDGNIPVEGDIIIVGTKEYLFTGVFGEDTAKWNLMGDEGTYATKAELSDEREARISADDIISAALTSEVDRAKDAEDELSSALTAEVSRATAVENTISNALTAEVERAEGVEDELSTAIKQKVWIKDAASDQYKNGAYSDLSVVKVTEDEYMEKVADGTLLKDGVLYVISSDHINAYGQKIVNLAEPELSSDAATKNYVDTVAKAVEDKALSAIELNGLSFDIANNKATLIISTINCGNATEVM